MSTAVSIKSVDKPFKIFVGNPDAPKTIHAGNIEPGKTTIKNGESMMEMEFSGGDESFPNYWEGWARRIIAGKAPESGKPPFEANDPLYKGELEFLDPKDENGSIIYCRYVKGQSTLDYQYQTTRLNIVTKEKDEENLMIVLPRGEHEIDPKKDKSWALTMKVHPMNGNSKTKTDRYKNTMYKEVVLMDTEKKEVKGIQVGFQAVKIINDAAESNNFERLKTLHTILCAKKEIPYNKADENDLYETLMRYAANNAQDVIDLVLKYKEETTNVIENAKSNNAFDTTTNGTLKVGLIKKEVLLDGLEAKGEAMIQYLFDTCMEPKSFDAINTLHQLSQTNFK